MSDELSVLLLEGYFTGSHEVWATGWQANSRHEIHLLTQPGSHWRHRMMASSVPLAITTMEHVARHGPPDVVVASDMVGLAAYLGMCRETLEGVPSVLYFHENQLTQPATPNGMGGVRDRHLAWVNWRSLLAADQVWFNSSWQLESMGDALEDLLSAGPAGDDQRIWLAAAREKFRVRPVGCDLAGLLANRRTDDAGSDPLVVWNHRWDHDKGLDVAITSMRTLASQGLGFRLAVVGSDDHHDPARAQRMLASLGDRVVHRGWMEPIAYRDLLCRADIVVASARQENFGISVVEAVAAGCVPVVPDALAYPESITDATFRYPPGRLTTALRDVISDLPRYRERCGPLRESLRRFDWSQVAPGDDDALVELVRSHADRRAATTAARVVQAGEGSLGDRPAGSSPAGDGPTGAPGGDDRRGANP